jgi:peptidoglycan/LPS O-acetylase OafA/YrhL
VPAVAAIALLLVWTVTIGPANSISFYGGLVVADLAALVVIAHIVSTERSPILSVLSTRPFVWIGRRSYGIYLFHPIVFAAIGTLGLSLWGSAFIRIAATFVVAGLSFRYLESYFLRRKRYPAPVVEVPVPAAVLPAPAAVSS